METKRGRLITVHGIDGTGKTTTTERVSTELQNRGHKAVNYDTFKSGRRNPFSEKKDRADKFGTPEERLVAYLESTMFHSDQINELLDAGFDVVKSRYLDDVLAHHSHLGVSEEVIAENLKKFPIAQPDLKVILTLDEAKRRERIGERGILDERDEEHKIEGSRLRYFEDYLKSAAEKAAPGTVLSLDSGTLNLDEVVEKIMTHLLTTKSTHV
jgi:thymidylate kinase